MDASEIAGEIKANRSARSASSSQAAFLVLDTETVPDGTLIQQIRYPDENLSPEDAIARAQAEARALSPTGSDFLPVTYQIPVAVCVLSLNDDMTIQKLACLD